MVSTAATASATATSSRRWRMAAIASEPRSVSSLLRPRLGTLPHPRQRALSGRRRARRRPRDGRLRGPRSPTIDRQSHDHARAFAEPALDPHVAAMQAEQALHDGQAETGAVVAAIIGGARLEERLAEPRQIVLRNPHAVVLDRHRKPRAFA